MSGRGLRRGVAAGGDVALVHRVGGTELRAAVDLDGGGLRALSFAGLDLVESYPAGTPAPCCSGAVLFPWPNRVRDGRWTQRGSDHELVVTEPERGNANHGLVLGARFCVESRTESEVVVAVGVEPQPGYPFAVRLEVSYRLTDHGLEVDNLVTNLSGSPAPIALGAHPYLRIGECPTADLAVRVGARTYLAVDAQLIPVGRLPVAGSAVDLRRARAVDGIDLNTCFGDLDLVDGRSTSVVAAPDGRAVELWADGAYGYVQVYSCTDFPRADGTGLALAVEPMTAPADALNSGAGLAWLEPGQTWGASWGIRPAGRAGGWLTPDGSVARAGA